MKCANCDVAIRKEFSYAIKNNQCPACGKAIMPPEQLAAFNSLKELLSNVPNVDAEVVANLVVANFELKQLFKTAPKKKLPKISSAGNSNEAEEVTTEVAEEPHDDMSDEEYDEAYKAQQVSEAKKKLKQMKQEAYEDALREQYGMGEIEAEGDVGGPSGFFDEEGTPIERFNRMKNDQLRDERYNKMLSGKGGFTRSSE